MWHIYLWFFDCTKIKKYTWKNTHYKTLLLLRKFQIFLYDPKLGSGCNLGKDLSKEEEEDQLVKCKNTELYLLLYIYIPWEKYTISISNSIRRKWEKYDEISTTIWGTDWYNMINEWGAVDHSKYEPRIEQTSIYVQVILNTRWTSVEYKIVIITKQIMKEVRLPSIDTQNSTLY